MGDLADFLLLKRVGDDDDVLEGDESFETGDCLIEEGGFVEKVQKLLGLGISAQGPEAGAAATGKNQGVVVVHLASFNRAGSLLSKLCNHPFFQLGRRGLWGSLSA